MSQSKISNPQSAEMTDMSNNSIFSETMDNPTNPEVQPIAEQSETAQAKSTRPHRQAAQERTRRLPQRLLCPD